MTERVRAVLLDLDDTLVVEYAAVEEAFFATCAEAWVEYDVEPEALQRTVREQARLRWYSCEQAAFIESVGASSFDALRASFRGEGDALAWLRAWAPAFRLETWTAALEAHGIRDRELARELAERFPEERRKSQAVNADAEPVLRALRPHYALAVVTNGFSDLQREKLESARLAPFFDVVLVSAELGYCKPDPRVFEVALERLGVSAAQAVMIGDGLRTDIAGARAAGIRSVWLRRPGVAPEHDIPADAEVSSLREAPDAVAGLFESDARARNARGCRETERRKTHA